MLLFGAISYDLFVFKSRFILGNVRKMFLKKADSIFQFLQWKLKICILVFDSEPCEHLSSIRWGSKNCQFMNSIFVTTGFESLPTETSCCSGHWLAWASGPAHRSPPIFRLFLWTLLISSVSLNLVFWQLNFICSMAFYRTIYYIHLIDYSYDMSSDLKYLWFWHLKSCMVELFWSWGSCCSDS